MATSSGRAQWPRSSILWSSAERLDTCTRSPEGAETSPWRETAPTLLFGAGGPCPLSSCLEWPVRRKEGLVTAQFVRDAAMTAAIFGFFSAGWCGWAQDDPPLGLAQAVDRRLHRGAAGGGRRWLQGLAELVDRHGLRRRDLPDLRHHRRHRGDLGRGWGVLAISTGASGVGCSLGGVGGRGALLPDGPTARLPVVLRGGGPFDSRGCLSPCRWPGPATSR